MKKLNKNVHDYIKEKASENTEDEATEDESKK